MYCSSNTNFLKFVPYKDRKKFTVTLKIVYTEQPEQSTLDTLLIVKEKWRNKYWYFTKSLNK